MLLTKCINAIKKVISLVIICIFNCLPIKTNKIFMFSYYGNHYGCNPKYISEYILKNYPKDKFDIVWAFNDLTTKLHLTGFRKVKTMSLRYFYELCTSRVIITNFRTTDLFIKRKDQYYIQTWHSSLRLKQIEKDAENSLPLEYVRMAKRDSKKCDLLISGCKNSTSIFKRAFWYEGNIFEYGTPRNDIFFQNNSVLRKKLLSELNLPSDSKLILYAPTFRKDENLDVYDINYQMISKTLNEKFGGNWILLVKLHPHLIAKSNQLIRRNNVMDVTSYDDIQELLSITDILISDYSSLMFDFGLTKRPCFLLVPDVESYVINDRNLYFNLDELPFISAVSNSELLGRIKSFDEEKYQSDLEEFFVKIDSYENGTACESLLKQINLVCISELRGEKSYGTEAI